MKREPIRLGCCSPVTYSPSSTTLIHSFMCEKSGKVLTREEYELWRAKAKHPTRPIIRWRALDRTPPVYEDSDPQWNQIDDDGYFERSESL